MKAFISLEKLFLLVFLMTGSLAYGQVGFGGGGPTNHFVIEDLDGTPRSCDVRGEFVTFQFCINLAWQPTEEEDPIYLKYTIGGVEYGPTLIPFSDFVPHGNHGHYRGCINSVPINTSDETCDQETQLMLLTSDDRINFTIYPIDDYTGIEEIFDCNEFDDVDCNLNWCFDAPQLPGPGEEPGLNCPAIIDGFLDLCCDGVGDQFNGGSSNDRNKGDDLNLSLANAVQVMPNPFSNHLQVAFQLETPQTVQLQLIDINGRLVYEKTEQSQAGIHQETINTDELSKGIYYLRLQTPSKTKSIKVIKL